MKVGYAVLYADGTLVISKNHTILQKKIEIDYGKFEDTLVPWKNEPSYIKKVQILNQVKSNCMKEWFGNCIYLTTLINFQNLDVSDCTDFSMMFASCKSLQDLKGLENWNVSNSTNFLGMFYSCQLLQDLNELQTWNVSNGKDFSYMFRNCDSLQNINELQTWNVSNCTNFSGMFYSCQLLQDLNGLQNWNVSNGTEFSSMFEYCELLQNILVSSTLSILRKDMFYNCNSTLKIHWKNHIYIYEDLLEYEKIY